MSKSQEYRDRYIAILKKSIAFQKGEITEWSDEDEAELLACADLYEIAKTLEGADA